MVKEKNIVAIVQARMGATRLPNKMMLWLNGYPVIEWVYRRVSKSRLVNKLIFAIPDSPQNDVLEIYLKKINAKVYRGSEDDLVDRFYCAAKENGAAYVVRICADNPLICPGEIDSLIDFYFAGRSDYAYNHIPRNNTYPDGLGAEMVSIEVLERIHVEAKDAEYREHVFNYILDNPDKFSIKTFNPQDKEIACPEIRLDIDTYEDYKRMLSKDITIDMGAREILSIFRGVK